MPNHTERIWKDGIPAGYHVSKIPKTPYWLEYSLWGNGNWHVKLLDPTSAREREVWRSIPHTRLMDLLDRMADLAAFRKKPMDLIQDLRKLIK